MKKSTDFLKELDHLTKIEASHLETNDVVLKELSSRLTRFLDIERFSLWLFNPDQSAIMCNIDFDSRTEIFTEGNTLFASKAPAYFEAIRQNKIILVENMQSDFQTLDLNDEYNIPLDVRSLMDVPLRLEGELIGVMCFEKTGRKRIFTIEEQTFASAVASIVTTNFQSHLRRAIQKKYEAALKEKETLIIEINHRVKNNFAVMMSLLRIARDKHASKDVDSFIDEHEKQVLAMVSVHDSLMHSKNPTRIALSNYLEGLISLLRESNREINSNIEVHIEHTGFIIGSKLATSLGLVISEIMTNSEKHGLLNGKATRIAVNLSKIDDESVLIIGDDGPGFDFQNSKKDNTLGLHLIEELSEDFEMSLPKVGSSYYEVRFK